MTLMEMFSNTGWGEIILFSLTMTGVSLMWVVPLKVFAHWVKHAE